MSAPTSDKKLRLADHVRACRIDNQVILLDLKRDRYQAVGGTPSAAMSNLITDWPVAETKRHTPQPASERSALASLLKALTAETLLVNAGTAAPSRPHLDEALDSWHPSDTDGPPSVSLQDMMQIAWSAAGAAYWLQRHPLAQIEDKVMCLRRQSRRRVATATDELRWQVSKYMRLRPFVLSARDRCLHDSLSLIRFLGARGLFPQWVIGVRTRPFTAHSWVQSGDLVLNDQHEHVRAFHPILVV